jgi:uncharacterized protein YukE
MKEYKATVMAAVMARTNMGQDMPDREKMFAARFSCNVENWTLDTAVSHFCQEFMENDEHHDIFTDEATMWNGEICELTDEEFAKKYPRHAAAWNGAAPKRHKNALEIIDGAGNPTPIARALYDAVQECREECLGTDKTWSDPAVRLIIHQMAHCSDQYAMNNTMTEFGRVLDMCRKDKEKFTNE